MLCGESSCLGCGDLVLCLHSPGDSSGMTSSRAQAARGKNFSAQALLSPPCSDCSRVPRFRCHHHLLPVRYWRPCPDFPSHAPWNLSLARSSSPSSFFSEVLWAQQRRLRPFLRPSAHPKMTLAPLDGAGVWSLSYGPCFSHCNLSSPWVSTLPASYIREATSTSAP